MKLILITILLNLIVLNVSAELSPGGFNNGNDMLGSFPGGGNGLSGMPSNFPNMPGNYPFMPGGLSGGEVDPFSNGFNNFNPNQSNPLLSKSCPFKKEVKGVKEILDSTKNQLSILANDTTCANVASAARVMNQTLSTSIQNAFEGQSSQNEYNYSGSYSSTSSGVQSCNANYEQGLSFDYNMALKMNSMDQSLIPMAYQRCIGVADFNKCTSDIYIAQLAYMGAKCPEEAMKKSRTQRNAQMSQIMKDLSDNFDALIRNSGSCSNTSVAQTVLQTSLNTVTAFSALAPSMGLAGVGLSIVGRMVGSLFDNLFDKNSPNKLLGAIKKEEQMEDLNCLNYMLQRETLQCEKLIMNEAPKAPQFIFGGNCYEYYYGNKDLSIKDFISSLEKIKTASNLTFSTMPNPALAPTDKSFDKIYRSMNKEIFDPFENKKIRFSSYLDKVVQNLLQSESLEARSSAQTLNDYLQSYKNLEKAMQDKSENADPKKVTESLELFKLKAKALANHSNGNLFENAIESFWENQGQASTLAKIKNVGRLRSDLQTGFESTLELYKGIQDLEASGGSQRKLDVAHTAFVNAFKERFNDRVSTLDKTLTANMSKQTRLDSMLDLVPLIQMCSLNAGIFYFNESNSELKSRNNIVSSIPSDYQKACGRFSCYMKVFDPKAIEKEDKRAEAFRAHQCILTVKYPQILNDVTKEFKEKGTICGK